MLYTILVIVAFALIITDILLGKPYRQRFQQKLASVRNWAALRVGVHVVLISVLIALVFHYESPLARTAYVIALIISVLQIVSFAPVAIKGVPTAPAKR